MVEQEIPRQSGPPRSWRKMSDFMCREMLYDYLIGDLDEERRQAIENHLEKSQQAQIDLDSLKYGVHYCQQLAKTEISPQLQGRLRSSVAWLHSVFRALYWRHWPDPFRWSVEAIVLASLVALVTSVIPWHQIQFIWPRDESGKVLARIEEIFSEQKQDLVESIIEQKQYLEGVDILVPEVPSQKDSTAGAKKEVASKGAQEPEKATDTAAEMQEQEPVPAPKVSRSAETSETVLSSEPRAEFVVPKLPLVLVAKNQTTEATAVVRNSSSTAASEPESQGSVKDSRNATEAKRKDSGAAQKEDLHELSFTDRTTGETDPKLRGVVYKTYMYLADLDRLTPEIANVIRGLGGEKNGNVKLGWRKDNKGSYYHFVLPKQQYGKMVTALRTYGDVRIYKDRHKDVMPEDIVRFILWIEDVRN